MAFQLKVSNSLNSLADALAVQMKNTNSVFQPIFVITQTEGMNNWLKLQIATRMGISANIQFLKPNDIINNVFSLLGGRFTRSISAHDLNWLLFKILAENEFISKYPKIAAYYHYEGLDSEVKRMALAEKIADLFDQYQIYRPEMIEKWNSKPEEDGEWQNYLWNRAKELAGKAFPDKTIIGKYILKSLEDPKLCEDLKSKMPQLHFFGISLITEYHLHIFHSLSKVIHVDFLLLNPAPYDYWYEDKSERIIDFLKSKNILSKSEEALANPLLVGWGKIIQDTFMLLFQEEQTLNTYEEVNVIEPATDTLLHQIQHAVFNNQKTDLHFSKQQIKDGSISINSCFSPVREVEVLYNYLVHLVHQKEEQLSARDIVVMVSDIDLYASYIKAVFDNAPYAFRYTIADESYAVSDSISNTLLEILSLTEQNFSSDKIVGLLDFSALRNHFQISDLSIIRQLVDTANIRFGIQGKREDDSDYISWDYGMKRIMYGLCMSGAQEYGAGEDSFYPLDLLEGFDSFTGTRFVYFVQALIESIQQRKRKQTISEWVVYIENTIRIFIGEKEELEDEDYLLLLHQLENYNVLEEIFTEPISYEVFLHNFGPILSNAKRSKAFVGGGITFCSLIPMRSIPFKVVALLGIDFDKFPRKDKKVSFDLMQQSKRRGDRNIKDNDKHLFLETLLSAEQYFYLSYIGQSVKDNTSFPPSALVDELIDFIASNSDDQKELRKTFVQKHPLHGYSKKYNSSNNALYTYLLERKSSLDHSFEEKKLEEIDFSEINLHQFVSFFKNPFKGFYNHVLNVYYDEEDLSLRETEIFQLDHLEQWSLRNQLLSIEDNDLFALEAYKVKTGTLPLKNMARVVLENMNEDIQNTKAIYQRLCSDFEEESLSIDLVIGDSKLIGTIQGIFNNQLIRHSFSKGENKYLLDAYLHYLILIAFGSSVSLRYISHNKGAAFSALSISQEEAKRRLQELLKIYKRGHFEILAFNCDFKISGKKLMDMKAENFDKIIYDHFNNFKAPCNDAYLKKEYANGFFGSEDIFERYRELAHSLLLPVENLFPDYPF